MDTGNADESWLSRDLNGLQNPESIAAFLEAAFDAVVSFDAQERITHWNPAATQMYGWPAREAIGKTPAELFWPLNTPQEKKSHRERQLRLKRGAMLWASIIHVVRTAPSCGFNMQCGPFLMQVESSPAI